MNVNTDYPCNPKNYRKGRTAKVEYLVIHYVGAQGGSLENAMYFCRNELNPPTSAHFFVGHASKPEIYRSVKEEDTAWAVGNKTYVHPYCRNNNSISIEMCCHVTNEGTWYFDDITILNTIALARDIVQRYNIPYANLIRHYDVSGKICPAPFVYDTSAWEKFKQEVYGMDETWEEEKTNAWQWAKDKGIMDGTNPANPISRNDLAVILRRIFKKENDLWL